MSNGIDDLPRIDDYLTNKEFVKACRSVVHSLHRRALVAKRRAVRASPEEKEVAEKRYLELAQSYCIISKIVQWYTQTQCQAAEIRQLVAAGTTPTDVN